MTLDQHSSAPDWVPDSCTLPTVEQPVRVAEFDDFFSTAVRGSARPSPNRLELTLSGEPAVAVGRELAARESGCCSFFTFSFVTLPVPIMVVEVPASRAAVLDAFAARVRERAGR